VICSACNGSGEGMSDGTICTACRGHGEFHAGNRFVDDEDERAAEADRAYDRMKDERAEREGTKP
jgi:hypothetical protein